MRQERNVKKRERGDESRQEREEREKVRGKERTNDGVEYRVHGRIEENGDVRTYTVEESEDTKEKIDYYIRPHHESLKTFFEYHPEQTSNNPVVQKVFWCKDGTNRRWLTYHQECHALHCSVCIAFAKSTDKSPFVSGMTDWKHVHQRLEEHEKSMAHKTCAEAYFLNACKSDVKHLVEVSCPHTGNKSERNDKYSSV